VGELVSKEGAFDLARWRRIVSRAAEIPCVHDAIVPFGFELLGEARYLRGRLGRFHVYLAVGDVDVEAATASVARSLVRLLGTEAPAFLATIEVMWGPSGRLYTGERPARRQICIWPVRGRTLLLPRWADYLAATPRALLGGKLYESPRVATDGHALRYVLQLGLIQEALFGKDVGGLPAASRRAVRTALRELEEVRGAPSPRQLGLFGDVVRPYAASIAAHLERPSPACRSTTVADIHGDDRLELLVSSSLRCALRAHVAASYAAYPCAAG